MGKIRDQLFPYLLFSFQIQFLVAVTGKQPVDFKSKIANGVAFIRKQLLIIPVRGYFHQAFCHFSQPVVLPKKE
jgi:hypothetical protein